jgi:hypothetical protein
MLLEFVRFDRTVSKACPFVGNKALSAAEHPLALGTHRRDTKEVNCEFTKRRKAARVMVEFINPPGKWVVDKVLSSLVVEVYPGLDLRGDA